MADRTRTQVHVKEACERLQLSTEAVCWTAEILDLTDAWFYKSECCGRAAWAAACLYTCCKMHERDHHSVQFCPRRKFPKAGRCEKGYCDSGCGETPVPQNVNEERRILQILEFEVSLPHGNGTDHVVQLAFGIRNQLAGTNTVEESTTCIGAAGGTAI